jgi:3',5'-cyclic AMP phosphodiesterase CpdA
MQPLQHLSEDTVTILHVSDTHSLHYSLGDLPSADIFIHSGDVSTVGSDGEVGDFNNWLGSLKGKYREMLVISGNHDYWETNWRLNRGALSDATAQSPNYFQEKITNAKASTKMGH